MTPSPNAVDAAVPTRSPDEDAWDYASAIGAHVQESFATRAMTLDTLPDLYAAERRQSGVTPARYREVAITLRDFIDAPGSLRGPHVPPESRIASIVFISGPLGVGKSLLLAGCIARVAMDQKRDALFTNPEDIWDRVIADRASVKRLQEIYALGIDDFTWKKSPTDWELSTLLRVVDERLRQNRITLLTANESVTEIAEMWSDATNKPRTMLVSALCDRLADRKHAISIAMSGRSLRRENARTGER